MAVISAFIRSHKSVDNLKLANDERNVAAASSDSKRGTEENVKQTPSVKMSLQHFDDCNASVAMARFSS